MKKVFFLCVASAVFLANSISQIQDERRSSITGTVKIIEDFESKVLANKRTIRIYLPPNYGKSNAKYPVLYMHDGQNIFDGKTSFIPNQEWRADETAEGLIRAGLIQPLIIVGIDNAGMERANEYLPTKSKLGEGSLVGGKASLYCKFVTDELMPYVQKNFRVLTGPKNTAVCGSSFGGIVSLAMGLERPDVFGKLGVVSPSLWWDDQVMTKKIKALPQKLNWKIWLDIGSSEGKDSVKLTTDFFDALKAKGWRTPNEAVLYVDQYARHNEGSWAIRMGMILLYLYGK